MLGVRLAALAYIQLKAVYAAYQLAQLAEAEVARVKIGLLFYKQAAELCVLSEEKLSLSAVKSLLPTSAICSNSSDTR